jgi:hypothetical protein
MVLGETHVGVGLEHEVHRLGVSGYFLLITRLERPDGDRPREQVFNVEYAMPIKNGPNAVGFDYYFGISASLDMVPYAFIENDKVTANPTEDRAFRMRADNATRLTRKGPAAPGFEAVDVLPTLAKAAVSYLEKRAQKRDEPFLLYLPLTTPHTPIAPSKDWAEKSGLGYVGTYNANVAGSVPLTVFPLLTGGGNGRLKTHDRAVPVARRLLSNPRKRSLLRFNQADEPVKDRRRNRHTLGQKDHELVEVSVVNNERISLILKPCVHFTRGSIVTDPIDPPRERRLGQGLEEGSDARISATVAKKDQCTPV